MRLTNKLVKATILGLFVFINGQPVFAQDVHKVELELEAGPVWQTRNDVQIPNTAAGTRFSLVDLAGKGPWAKKVHGKASGPDVGGGSGGYPCRKPVPGAILAAGTGRGRRDLGNVDRL